MNPIINDFGGKSLEDVSFSFIFGLGLGCYA